MKTKPMSHQLRAREFLRTGTRVDYAALGAEQGTGKTWMLMDDAEFQFEEGRIDALMVIAPKGVHTNWVLREIPKHMSVSVRMGAWKSGMGKRHKEALDKLLWPRDETFPELVVVALNNDAINTPNGLKYAAQFLRAHRTMLAVDESHNFKNPDAVRTTKLTNRLARLSTCRRIASGTLVADKPLDLFGQYEFLRPGLLGTSSYRTFVSEYSELIPSSSPLIRGIMEKKFTRALAGLYGKEREAKLSKLIAGAKGGAQIVKRDKEGRPQYKNLTKLGELIKPHTFRVEKKDVLDLPEKIYQTHFYDLPPKMRKLYNQVRADRRYLREDGELDIYTALTVINKRRQLASGFIMAEGTVSPTPDSADEDALKARLTALETVLDGGEGPVIIWCSFREEVRRVAERLVGEHGPEAVVQYHGGTSDKDRETAVDRLQNGEATYFVASYAASSGLTLTAAERAVYYSVPYELVKRSQSEDRNHRIGTKNNVVYTDLVATDTINERIALVLQSKRRDASTVMDVLREE